MQMKKKALATAVAAAVASIAVPMSANAGEYRSGDFHNHTTCSDGSTSVRTLTREALVTYGHDWFIHVGHSGRGPRDCRVSDFLYHAFGGGAGVGLWSNADDVEVKGDERLRNFTITSYDGSTVTQTVEDMWRWQSLQEFNLGGIVAEREFPGNEDKVAFLGLEWTVPGHEHSSNTLITGQYEDEPNSDAIAQFEYCFGRPSDDTSKGGGQGWTCELSEENNKKLLDLFGNRPEEGTADYNATLVAQDGVNTDDTGEHVKAAAAVLWMDEKFPGEGMAVQAHVERQGAFLPGQNRGWNVEHMRDMNTLAPSVAFGFESQPGHQAQPNRGSYSPTRPTAGFWTYGGTGAYAGAEVSMPGLNFDGEPIDPAVDCVDDTFQDQNCGNIPRTVLSRPGVRTMWDAMLSEGRKFWFYGSSDWHNRGSFGPLDFEATNDFWPGEYQDNFTYIEDNNPDNPAQDVVDGLRSGNVYVVQGQLIDKMKFKACSRGKCATMGETLKVRKGATVTVTLNVRDPKGKSKSPYTFNNPFLTQIGIEQPLNKPELAHAELIMGKVGSIIPASDPEYYNPMAPETTKIVASYGPSNWGSAPQKKMKYTFKATHDAYVRARGSNIPPNTPHKRDMDGNPLPDYLSSNVICDDALCPPHLADEDGVLRMNFDVEAWGDIWFYANPIFIELESVNPYFAKK